MPRSQQQAVPDRPSQGFRQEFIAKVRGTLTRHGYQPEDFEVTQQERADDVALDIVYRFMPEYGVVAWYQTHEDPSGEWAIGSLGVKMTPGDLLHHEFTTCKNRHELLKAIAGWVDRLHSELRAIPVNRHVEEQQRIIDDLVSGFAEHSEEFFTREEAQDLAARLDDLEERMAANIEARDDGDAAKVKVAELREEIDLLKAQLSALNKKNWAKSVAVRIATWMKDPDNRKLLKAGADVVKTLMLPPGSPPGAV